jgi:hypothetical protein
MATLSRARPNLAETPRPLSDFWQRVRVSRVGAGRVAAERGRHSSVLKQPEDVAIWVGDGGHQAAAAYVAHGLLHRGTGRGHLGQLRLDVRHVPVGHR